MQKKMQSMEGQFDTYTEQAGILFVFCEATKYEAKRLKNCSHFYSALRCQPQVGEQGEALHQRRGRRWSPEQEGSSVGGRGGPVGAHPSQGSERPGKYVAEGGCSCEDEAALGKHEYHERGEQRQVGVSVEGGQVHFGRV